MKKAALFLGICAILVLLAFTPFWGYIYQFFQAKGLQGNYSQLHFQSSKGDYQVFIDNELKGEVADKQKKDIPQVKPGSRTIKIVRKSELSDFFYVLEKTIEFIPSSQVEIEWEAGPTLESSTGTIKYFNEIIKPDGAEVYIRPFPNNAIVQFDSKTTEGNTFDVFDTKNHTIKVSMDEDSESITSKINVTDESTNKVLKNLKLVIEVYLYKMPFEEMK
jgi:hypothetical protein